MRLWPRLSFQCLFGIFLILSSGGLHLAHGEGRSTDVAATATLTEKKLRALIREFPRAYALTDPSTDKKTFNIRLALVFMALSERFSLPEDALTEPLLSLAKKTIKDSHSPKLERAAASFLVGQFVQAEQIALAAGDEAHRDHPRRPNAIVESLQLAAYAAIVQTHYSDGHNYLNIASGETDPDRDLTQWVAVKTAQAHLDWLADRPAERIATLRGILKQHQRLLGDSHAATLRHHNEFAGALYDHSYDAEAEKEFRALLHAMLRGSSEPNSSAIQAIRKNLAKVIEAQGRFAEALPVRQEIVRSQTATLGAEHPFTVSSRFDLAMNLTDQGRQGDGAAEYAAILDIRQRTLGKDDPGTLVCRSNLAVALRDQGKFAEALTQFQILNAAQKRLYGGENEATLKSASAVGVCFNDLRRGAEAEEVLAEVVRIRTRCFGAEHLETLADRNNLAIAHGMQGKVDQAEKGYRAVLAARERLLGPDHPKTLGVRNNLYSLLDGKPKKSDQVLEEQRAIAERMTAIHGADHIQTLMGRFNLALALENQSRFPEAEKVYREVLKACEKTLGLEHPSTVNTRAALAGVLVYQNRLSEAEKELLAVREMHRQTLDEDDLNLHINAMSLAYVLAKQDRLKEAIDMSESAYAGLLRSPDAPKERIAEAKTQLETLSRWNRKSPLPPLVNAPASNPPRIPQVSSHIAAPSQTPISPPSTINAPLLFKP